MAQRADFPLRKNPDLRALSDEVHAHWQHAKTFERTLQRREGAPKWVFYEGPPSANGLPGIHHVMGRALKDLFCRYKTQRGYLVERRAGWDTHGLPVELNVEKSLGITKEDIGKTVSIEDYNAACRRAVMRYSEDWRRMTERIGFWVDLDQPYITYDSKYIESVWWSLQRLHDGGHLYRGHTIQPYSPMAGSGLSTHELNQPGCYRDVTDLSLTAMFRLCTPAQQAARSAAAGQSSSAAAAERIQSQYLAPLGLSLEQVHVLAWTTTPWTLPSNTALAINPSFRYSLVETLHRYSKQRVLVLLAEGLIEQVFPAGEYQAVTTELAAAQGKARPYRQLATLPGVELVGLWYEQLLPWALPAQDPEQAFRIVAGDFVSLEDGTGVVHVAPTFGADDAQVAKAAGVPPLRVLDAQGELTPLVDERGRFVRQLQDGRGLAGRFVKASYYEGGQRRADASGSEPGGTPRATVDEEIASVLKERGLLFRSQAYQHSYPHCWRTDTPILYYPLKSWFIRTTAFKDELIQLNQTITWYPPSTGEGRFGEWLQRLSDWNLSRSRFWGIPLPIWATEDGSEVKCIGSFAELKAEIRKSIEHGVMSEDPFAAFHPGNMSAENYAQIDVHRPFVDRVKLVSSSGKVMTREPEVIDVWFDSGAMPYAQEHYPFENRTKIESGSAYPADFIAEGVDQTRGWFFTLHAISTMMFGSVAFKSVLSHGLLLDAEGRKMSKRLGNVIDPVALLDSYGPDPVRWYMITNSPPWQNLSFDPEGVAEVVRKFYRSLWSTYSFFATYANADGFTGTEPTVSVAERQLLDRWILSELQVTVQTATSNLESFDATRAFRAVQSFLIDSLSNWYVRLNRKRFWKAELNADKLAAYQTLRECLLTVSKLIAPVSPFHAERLYLDLTAFAPELDSVHETNYPNADTSQIDGALNEQMSLIRKAASMTLSLRKDSGIKVRQPLAKLTVITDERSGAAIAPLVHLLADEVNVKRVEVEPPTSAMIERSAQLNFREAGPRFGKQTKLVADAVKALGAAELLALGQGQSVQLEVAGERLELPPELVKINVRGKAGAQVLSEDNLTIVLDTALDESLRGEGFARELVSAIQRLRKSADFAVTTRIRLEAVRHPLLDAALARHGDYLRAETLCEGVSFVDALDGEPVEVEDASLQLRVSAVS